MFQCQYNAKQQSFNTVSVSSQTLTVCVCVCVCVCVVEGEGGEAYSRLGGHLRLGGYSNKHGTLVIRPSDWLTVFVRLNAALE